MSALRVAGVTGIIAAGILTGCGTPFLHAGSTAQSTVVDSGLVGEWVTEGSTVTRAVIAESPGGHYSVALSVQHEGNPKTSLNIDAVLFESGGEKYWDLFLSREERDRLVDNYGFLVVPVHQMMKMSRDKDELNVWSFDPSWLEQTAKATGSSYDRVEVGGDEVTLITGPTDRVRDLLEKSAKSPQAFGDAIVFHRVVR